MSFIEVSQLTKVFRHAIKEPGLLGAVKHLVTQKHVDKTAVDHINLRIEEGEAVAYVGPNGAGKSTTIKMMSGILVPTSGSVCGRSSQAYRFPEGSHGDLDNGSISSFPYDLDIISP